MNPRTITDLRLGSSPCSSHLAKGICRRRRRARMRKGVVEVEVEVEVQVGEEEGR